MIKDALDEDVEMKEPKIEKNEKQIKLIMLE